MEKRKNNKKLRLAICIFRNLLCLLIGMSLSTIIYNKPYATTVISLTILISIINIYLYIAKYKCKIN